MKHYFFTVANNKIDTKEGEVDGTGPDYNLYEGSSFGGEEVYYKTVDGKVTDIICQAFNEKGAEKAVKSFLDNLILA